MICESLLILPFWCESIHHMTGIQIISACMISQEVDHSTVWERKNLKCVKGEGFYRKELMNDKMKRRKANSTKEWNILSTHLPNVGKEGNWNSNSVQKCCPGGDMRKQSNTEKRLACFTHALSTRHPGKLNLKAHATETVTQTFWVPWVRTDPSQIMVVLNYLTLKT